MHTCVNLSCCCDQIADRKYSKGGDQVVSCGSLVMHSMIK